MSDPIVDDLFELFADEITYEAPPTSPGVWGESDAYGAAQTITCRIINAHKIVRSATGGEQVSTVQVWLAGVFDVEARGRFTLPSRYDPRTPTAIAIELFTDENGPHHERVMF